MNKHNKKDTRHGYWEIKYHNGKVNEKGLEHGYWEWRYPNSELRCKCTVNDGMWIGYREWYLENGETHRKEISI